MWNLEHHNNKVSSKKNLTKCSLMVPAGLAFAIIKRTEKELIFDSNNHICDGICQLDP